MVKFKIFFGDFENSADEIANKWLIHNPNIEILQMKYIPNSICIMYKEN